MKRSAASRALTADETCAKNLIVERLPALGRVLADLRGLCGLSITACARRMGVPVEVLQQAEEGLVDDELFAAAARAFGLDERELREGYVASDNVTVYLYHSAGLQMDQRDAGVCARAMAAGRAVATLSASRVRAQFAPVMPPAGGQARDAAEQGHRLARRVRADLRLGDEPLGDMRALFEDLLGIPILVDECHTVGLRALSVVDVGRSAAAAVLVDGDEYRDQNHALARVYLAHELCHILFDPSTRGGVRIALDDSATGRVGVAPRGLRSGDVELLESRAKGFAAEFLLPLAGIAAYLGEPPRRTATVASARALVHRVREHFGAPWEMTTLHLTNHRYIDMKIMTEVRYAPAKTSREPPATSLPEKGAMPTLVAHVQLATESAQDVLAAAARAVGRAAVVEAVQQAASRVSEAIEAGEFERATEQLAERATQAEEADAMGDLVLGLLELQGARLPEYLAWGLFHEGAHPAFYAALILTAEQFQILDPGLRERVVEGLRGHALRLRSDETRREVLWSALRRYCSMLPLAVAGSLIEFLGDDEAPATLQVVVQGLVSIFTTDSPEDDLSTRALRQRVHALAEKFTASDTAHDLEGAALVSCLVQAACALRDPELARLVERVEKLDRKALTERVVRAIGAMSVRSNVDPS